MPLRSPTLVELQNAGRWMDSARSLHPLAGRRQERRSPFAGG